MSSEPTVAARRALSFAAAFAGWVAGIVWYVANEVLRGPGYVTDFEAVVAWSGLFVLAAWVLALAPLAVRLDPASPLCRLPLASIVGGAAGVLCCALLLLPLGGLALLARPLFLGQAAVVGAASATLHVVAVRRWRWLAAHPVGGAWLCAAGPFAATGAFLVAVAPAVERLAPSVAYRFGTFAVRERVFERTLRALRTGDSIARLRAALPGEFRFETTRTTGAMGALRYRIEFADGRVTAVDLRHQP